MSIFIVWSPGDLTGLVRWWMNQDGDQFSKGKRSQRRTGRKEPAPPDNHPKILTGKATVYKQTIDRFVLHSFFAPYCPNTNRKSCYRSLCFLLPLTEHSPVFIFNNLSFLWFLQRFFFFCCCFYTSFFYLFFKYFPFSVNPLPPMFSNLFPIWFQVFLMRWKHPLPCACKNGGTSSNQRRIFIFS